jgi:hypothetical protein
MTEQPPIGTDGPADTGAAGKHHPAAPEPGLAYSFTAEVTVDPAIEQGPVDGARARFIPITGGIVRGRVNGRILPYGGDWQTVRPGGLTEIIARYFLELDDGTIVEVTNPGVRTATEEVIGQLTAGEPVDPDAYYMRTQPTFRVAGERYDWMNRTVFAARGLRTPDNVTIDFYEVT